MFMVIRELHVKQTMPPSVASVTLRSRESDFHVVLTWSYVRVALDKRSRACERDTVRPLARIVVPSRVSLAELHPGVGRMPGRADLERVRLVDTEGARTWLLVITMPRQLLL